MLSHSDRTARIAAQALSHPLREQFSFRTTSALIDIARSSTVIHPDDADRLVMAALAVVIDAEVMAGRQREAT
jgi:hypothetical protein